MAETLAVKLARVQATIATLEALPVEATSIQGRSVTYRRLEVLYARERSLERRIANASQISRTVAEM